MATGSVGTSGLARLIPDAPAVLNPKTETPVEPSGYKSSVLQWREAARAEALATLRQNPEWDRVRTYIDMLEGRQWNRPLPRYRSRYYENLMAQMRKERISLLTDIRPAIEVRSDLPDYQKQAEIAQKVIYHEWARKNLDMALVMAVDHALFSVGYWKISASAPGDIYVLPCGMDTVLPIQPGLDIQDSTAVLFRTYKRIADLQRKYGKAAEGLERHAASPVWSNLNYDSRVPGYMSEYTWNSLSPAMRHIHGMGQAGRAATGTRNFFPVVEVEEYWIDDHSVNETSSLITIKDPRYPIEFHNYHYQVKPGNRLFPRKRLLVIAGDIILYDGPSPYWHGLFPFSQLVLNPHVWGPGGLSVYRDLVPMQRAVNELGAGVLDMARRAVEPQLVAPDGAVPDAAWNAFSADMPGGKLKVNPIHGRDAVGYLTPPPLPPYVGEMMNRLGQVFERMSGNVDATALGRKLQVPGGDTIEQMRDSLQSAFRLESRFMEPFLRSAGLQAISHIFQFYTREKRMWVFGPDGITIEDFDFDPENMKPWTMPKEDHWKLFSVVISQGSLHGAARDREKQIAISLFRLGAISRRELLRRLDWCGPERMNQIEMELLEQSGSLAPDATGKGQVPRLTRGARTGNPY